MTTDNNENTTGIDVTPIAEHIHPDDVIEYCYKHPQTEAYLHCYECNKPICSSCAQRTPVGYICPDCKKGRKQRFDKSKPHDLVIAGVASLVLGLIASIIPWAGNLWFVLILSPIAGTLISEAVWRLVGRRWGPKLWWITTGGIILATAPVLILKLLGFLALSTYAEGINVWSIINLIVPILHAGIATAAAITRLRLT